MKGNAIIHLIKYWLRLENAHSQTTVQEQALIKQYSEGAKIALEIGVYEGINTLNIARSIASEGKLFAIDPFFKGTLGICYSEIIAKSLISKNGLQSKVIFIKKLSFESVQDVPDDIDFIFIDGDHSLEGIKKDWKDWSEKLKIGGFIALHDTEAPEHNPAIANLGSYQYFNSYIKFDSNFEICDKVDSMHVLRRTK